MVAQGGDLPDWNRRVSVTDDTLVTTVAFVSPGTHGPFDVSQFNSVIVSPFFSPLISNVVTLNWQDPDGNVIASDFTSSRIGLGSPEMIVPVRAQQVTIASIGGALGSFVKLYGSMRQVDQMVCQGFPAVVSNIVASQSLALNQIYDIGAGYPQGWCQVDLGVSGSTTVAGEFLIEYIDTTGNSVDQRFADTTEFHAVSNNQQWHGQVIFPAVPFKVRFICRTAGTAGLTCNVIALGH